MNGRVWILLSVVLLAGCRQASRVAPVVATSTKPAPVPSAKATILPKRPPASPTESPVLATVWSKDPSVPILLYHQFAPDATPTPASIKSRAPDLRLANKGNVSTATKVRLSDFRKELDNLYQSGYSLVSFQKWVEGDLELPAGRHPLILTMDDLFFNNQITLQDDGTPSPETGIGILWQFYQEHPDFGFHLALFVNLGDKLYANPDNPNWQDKLAAAIVWCIEHDAMPYNHTYTHARLDRTDVAGIKFQLSQNDLYLRQLLLRAGRSDLIPSLGNYLALPYDIWPTSKAGVDAIQEYVNPEGQPMQGVLEADYVIRERLLPPPYSAQFDRWHIPRITVTLDAVSTLVQQSSQMPSATTCNLGPAPDDSNVLRNLIGGAIHSGACPPGIYVTRGYIFDATMPADVKLVFSAPASDAP